jgi:tetratricopeptide (TPR) repeat protein
MGEVWAARHVERGWAVALKRVSDVGRGGWADPLSEVRVVAAMAHPHVVRGTPAFMAPEQFEATPERWGPATDLYALGCLAGVLVSGAPPFQATTLPELVVAHRRVEPSLGATRFPVPRGFADWWAALLAKDPAERPALAADARAGLERLDWGAAFSRAPSVSIERRATFASDDAEAEGPAEPEPEAPPERTVAARLVPDASLIDVRVLPLVGRREALARLRAALAGVGGGPSRWVAIEGPDGIGRRHLARSFAWAAQEAGEAQPPPGRPGRPVVHLAFAGDDEGQRRAAGAATGALVLAVGCTLPGEPVDRVVLGPLSRPDAARLVRSLAPLDESLVAQVANLVDGHPGRLIGRIREWAAAGTLVPGPTGLVLDPSRDAGLEAEVDGADPLAALTWRVEEDADRALVELRAAFEARDLAGRPGRTLWLVGLAERALARASRPDPVFAAKVAGIHAGTLVSAGQLSAAATVTERLVARARAVGDPDGVAQALLQRAHVVRFLGQDPTPLLLEAEALAPSPAIVARARATRGSERIRQDRFDEAVVLLRSAEALLVDHGLRPFLGTIRFWLANALYYRGDLEPALAAERAAADTFREIGHATGEANALLQLATIALDLGRVELARGAWEEARRAAALAESPWLDAELAAILGCVHEADGDLDAAVESLEHALARAADAELPAGRLHLWLARVLARRGRRTEAAHQPSLAGRSDESRAPGVDVAALRLATLPSTDPRWAEALERCRSSTLTHPVQGLLGALADGGDRVVAEAARSVLATDGPDGAPRGRRAEPP